VPEARRVEGKDLAEDDKSSVSLELRPSLPIQLEQIVLIHNSAERRNYLLLGRVTGHHIGIELYAGKD
jgi:hypothetical protein